MKCRPSGSPLRSPRSRLYLFRLTPNPAAGLAVERVEKLVGVAGADHLPHRAPLPEQILLAAADAGQPVHPGQQPGVLQRLQRDADSVAVTLGGGGDLLVARAAPFAAIGAVAAPEQRAQHPIRAVVGAGRCPDASLGVAVEAVRGRVSEYLLALWPQMSRQNKLHAGSSPAHWTHLACQRKLSA